MSTFKKIIDNPYLAPVMTPLKWIGNCLAFATGPYVEAAKKSKLKKTNSNPVMNYIDRLMEEADGLVMIPMILGFVGGLIGGMVLSAKLLATFAWPLKIMGGLAVTSATLATSVAVAPVAVAAVIVGATLVAATSVATVPGILVGMKKTVDHVMGKNTAAPAANTAAPATPPATVLEQLSAQLAALPEKEQKALLDNLRNKASNDFSAKAGSDAAATLDKDITVTKTIKLKGNNP